MKLLKFHVRIIEEDLGMLLYSAEHDGAIINCATYHIIYSKKPIIHWDILIAEHLLWIFKLLNTL